MAEILLLNGFAIENGILGALRLAQTALIASALVDLGDLPGIFVDRDRPGWTVIGTMTTA